jgi:hypothetical protein
MGKVFNTFYSKKRPFFFNEIMERMQFKRGNENKCEHSAGILNEFEYFLYCKTVLQQFFSFKFALGLDDFRRFQIFNLNKIDTIF